MSIVYQSLVRPKLHRGAEWIPSAINNIAALTMLVAFLIEHSWWCLLAAAYFYWPQQWLLQVVARHDFRWTKIYFRSLRHPAVFLAHGYAHDRESKPPPILPRQSKWIK